MTLDRLSSLPAELKLHIGSYLDHFSRPAYFRSTKKHGLDKKQKHATWLWTRIFKRDTWIRKVLKIQNPNGGSPIPCLVGENLAELKSSGSQSAFLALLVNDWTGDTNYYQKLFFKCLRKHSYDPITHQVAFWNCGIVLQVADVVGAHEEDMILMKDPRKLFRLQGDNLSTYVRYYTDDTLHKIGPSQIGRVEGVSMREKGAVADICSIQLEFRDGSPARRTVISTEKTLRVVNITKKDANGQLCIVGWRPAKPHEREWWP